MRAGLRMAAALPWLLVVSGYGTAALADAAAATPEERGARLAPPPPRPATSSGEGGAGLATPSPRGAGPESEAEGASATSWQGPRVELGYVRYRLGDGHGGGVAHGAHFGGYLPAGRARLGLYGEMAGRDYAPGRSTDFLVRGTVVAGYQHLAPGWPVLPYAAVVGTGGVLLGKRFATAMTHTLWGAGMEIGVDAPVSEPLWMGASFSWIRVTMDGLRYDLWILRMRVGL